MNKYIYRVQLKILLVQLVLQVMYLGNGVIFYEYCLKNLNVISKFINTKF